VTLFAQRTDLAHQKEMLTKGFTVQTLSKDVKETLDNTTDFRLSGEGLSGVYLV
jgi:hypothetical protein